MTASASVKQTYMNNETLEHRSSILNEYSQFSNVNKSFLEPETHFGMKFLNSLATDSNLIFESIGSLINNDTEDDKNIFINSLVNGSVLKYERNVMILNSHFNLSKVKIGENSILNDLTLVKN
jgi:hypothetical protein